MLRGPQTVGEIRGRTDRLFEFSDLSQVQETLDKLAHRDEPLVVRLDRQVGQKDARYAHLLSGEVDIVNIPATRERSAGGGSTDRIEKLEAEVASLKTKFEAIKTELAEFRRQFE